MVNPLDEYALDQGRNIVDVMAETGAYERAPYAERLVHPHRLDNNEYEHLIATLNTEQRNFVYHIKYQVQLENNSFHYFLTGDAGKKMLQLKIQISVLRQNLRNWEE